MSHNLNDYGDILNTADVRAILGIGANKVYDLLSSGQIKNFKIGNVRKIPKWCLQEYIDKSVAVIHNNFAKENADDSSS